MNRGKNFNLFLMDGDVTGRIKCTLSNWTGVAYEIPRTYLDKCKERQDLKQSGIYFLFSKNENSKDEVYIGQAGIRKNGEGILLRVMEHLKDEQNYFNDVVILTTQNNSFGPTEITYLENRFTNMASQAERYVVLNRNEPNPGHVTEEKESELEDFVDYSQMVLGVLGYKLFVPFVKSQLKYKDNEESNEGELLLYLYRKQQKSKNMIEARCVRTDEGFVVLKGSTIVKKEVKSLPKSVKELRAIAREEGEIVDGILQNDRLFSSPSSAAAFVLGQSVNGRDCWKTENGLSLKDLEESDMG